MTRYAAVVSVVFLIAGCSQSQPVFLGSEAAAQTAESAGEETSQDQTMALKPTMDWSDPSESKSGKAAAAAAEISLKSDVDLSDLNGIPNRPASRRGFAQYPADRKPALQVASARDTRPSSMRPARHAPKISPNLPTKIELRKASARDLRKVIAAYEGKVVFVDFWATWCGPCVSMFPHTVRMHELAHQHDLRVITVSLDDQFKQQNVLQFLNHYKATTVNLLAIGDGIQPLSYEFGIPDGAIPHFRVYDRKGEKRYQWSGAGADIVKDIKGRIVKLIREK